MTDDEAISGAKEFLLQEYQSLYALHQDAKAVGETRLNFFVAFVSAVATAIVALQSFVVAQFQVWLISGMAIISIIVTCLNFYAQLE